MGGRRAVLGSGFESSESQSQMKLACHPLLFV
jgi:hypothetical protein